MRAVEETMRHSPSMCSTVRSVADDADDRRVHVSCWDFIIVNTYAANRDQSVYDDPTRFDITREDPPPILTFGGRRALPPGRQPGAARARGGTRQSCLDGSETLGGRAGALKPLLGLSGPPACRWSSTAR